MKPRCTNPKDCTDLQIERYHHRDGMEVGYSAVCPVCGRKYLMAYAPDRIEEVNARKRDANGVQNTEKLVWCRSLGGWI